MGQVDILLPNCGLGVNSYTDIVLRPPIHRVVHLVTLHKKQSKASRTGHRFYVRGCRLQPRAVIHDSWVPGVEIVLLGFVRVGDIVAAIAG